MIRLEPWSDLAAHTLKRVAGLDLSNIRREVEQGVAQLWHCVDSDGNGGYVVTRVEQLGNRREWVWLAGAGKGFLVFAPLFLKAAQEQGLSVRVYINRPGMRRLYDRLGFHVSEVVMRKFL
jgi:hypothetical protein